MALSSQAPSWVTDPLPGCISTAFLRHHEPSSKTKLRRTLELAYPHAGDAELSTQLGQGRRLSAIQPIPAYQNTPLPILHLLQ